MNNIEEKGDNKKYGQESLPLYLPELIPPLPSPRGLNRTNKGRQKSPHNTPSLNPQPPLSAACAPPLYLRSWPRPRAIDAGVRRAGRREGLVRAVRLEEEEAAVFRAHLHPYRATDERRKFPTAALNRSLARSLRRLVGSPLGVRRGSAAVSEEAICRSLLSLAVATKTGNTNALTLPFGIHLRSGKMASPQPSPSRISKYTAMGHRYLSRWVSWSGTLTTPPGSPSRGSPAEGPSLSPQPPRAFQPRSRTSSKASNVSEKTPVMYPLVPKLPVPPLGHTLTWYLTHMRPVLSREQYEETVKIVDEFWRPGGVGEKIQEELIKRHDTMDNWAYEWWLDDMYMNVPLPLPVNSNPGMVFPHQKFASDLDMTQFAARLVSASLDMKERIAAGDLDVDRCSARERHQPLCMAQYTRVFSSYRRPRHS
ncbi:hypothetical protein O3P69_016516 [Scylla paramamosain]|uniref:Choline O-acetyltransferase n=1 Tax=Scylla paramamosain TaxID=85552 RepID=A0AAW0TEA5_SCYPA